MTCFGEGTKENGTAVCFVVSLAGVRFLPNTGNVNMLGQMKAWIKSSPLGLASILVAIAIVCGCVMALELQLSKVGTDPNENHFAEALLVICVFSEIALLSSLSALLGLVLSIASFVLSEAKIFALVGLSLNGAILVLAGTMVLTIFGG